MDYGLLLIVAVLLILPVYVLIFILIPLVFGAPFEGSQEKVVKKMLASARPKKSDKVADLGSGDGRIVIAFAQKGIESHGFEINPLLVLYSRWNIRRLGLHKRAFIHWKNFWNTDLSSFTIINVFQISYLMPRLEKKLTEESLKGTKVISNTWKFPHWKTEKSVPPVYVYRKQRP